ncbi:MAG: TonB family protein [Bacteroidales bacterium]|nr:TonB family protein [Bacteroidales bacterium]
MKLLSLIFLCFLSLAGANAQFFSDTIFYNQSHEETAEFDSNGFYRVIANDTSGEIQFVVNDYYPNAQLKMSGTFRSINPDRQNGLFTYYYPNGAMHKKCSYSNNALNGLYQIWYNNGQLKQECTYVNNKLEGPFNSWSPEGVPTKKANYKAGKKHGRFITYYSNGNPVRIEKYHNDKMVKARCYTTGGKDTAYFKHFVPPSFSGGTISDFTAWVNEKLQYPAEARQNKEEGEVNVKFTINRYGKVESVRITKLDRNYFNNEVLRVISGSPIWVPARRDAETIEVSIEIPIKFTLPEIGE